MPRSPDEIAAISRFLPLFDDPGFEPGRMVCEDDWSGELAMPHVDYDGAVSAFMDACYQSGWILTDFDWPEWAGMPEAEALRDDPAATARATSEQVARMLTVLVRQERFSDGSICEAIRSGLVSRLLRRVASPG